MVFCCAPGCKSRGGKLKRGSQTFHRFPTHPLLRQKWVEAVARVGWTPNNSRLCSLHFRDGDYDGSADLQRSRLKFGAVPSVFERARQPDTVQVSVARRQNLILSFPWIAPGWRVGGAIQGKEGIKFCRVA